MLNRKLGNTGVAVGKIALGTMYFGSETPEKDAFKILDTFIEAGGNPRPRIYWSLVGILYCLFLRYRLGVDVRHFRGTWLVSCP